mgnify:CR=1 FL=1
MEVVISWKEFYEAVDTELDLFAWEASTSGGTVLGLWRMYRILGDAEALGCDVV